MTISSLRSSSLIAALLPFCETLRPPAIVTGTPALFYNYPHRPHPLSSVRLLRMKKVDLTTVFCDKIHFLSFLIRCSYFSSPKQYFVFEQYVSPAFNTGDLKFFSFTAFGKYCVSRQNAWRLPYCTPPLPVCGVIKLPV